MWSLKNNKPQALITPTHLTTAIKCNNNTVLNINAMSGPATKNTKKYYLLAMW